MQFKAKDIDKVFLQKMATRSLFLGREIVKGRHIEGLPIPFFPAANTSRSLIHEHKIPLKFLDIIFRFPHFYFTVHSNFTVEIRKRLREFEEI